MDVKSLQQVPSFITKDGSEIRELLAYRNSGIRKQSLAEARLKPGESTTHHYHVITEEIYFILQGRARMRVGAEFTEVKAGDAIAIPPGALHQIMALGSEQLRLLCCCVPPYEDEDTVLMEDTRLA